MCPRWIQVLLTVAVFLIPVLAILLRMQQPRWSEQGGNWTELISQNLAGFIPNRPERKYPIFFQGYLTRVWGGGRDKEREACLLLFYLQSKYLFSAVDNLPCRESVCYFCLLFMVYQFWMDSIALKWELPSRFKSYYQDFVLSLIIMVLTPCQDRTFIEFPTESNPVASKLTALNKRISGENGSFFAPLQARQPRET